MQVRIKYITLLISIFLLHCTSLPEQQNSDVYTEVGKASWYGPGFQGKKTANGEKFDMNKLTAAHKTLEFGTFVRVTNISNKKKVIVKINDRGPYAKNRIIDLSKEAAERIDMVKSGIAEVKIEVVTSDEIKKF